MPVVTRYFAVTVPQGMPHVQLDTKSCATCRTLPDESSDRRQALRVTVAGTPARSKRLLIASVAAAVVLMAGAVTGCSHANSAPAAMATPAPAASPTPSASPLAGIWRNDDPGASNEVFEFRINQVDRTVYLTVCGPAKCAEGKSLAGQLTADNAAVFTEPKDPKTETRVKLQIDTTGHLLAVIELNDLSSGMSKLDRTYSFHKAG